MHDISGNTRDWWAFHTSVVVQSQWYFVEKYLPPTKPTDNDAIVTDIQ